MNRLLLFRVICVFIVFSILFSGCGHSSHPLEQFGYTDATNIKVRKDIEDAIAIVNEILSGQAAPQLQATWATQSSPDPQKPTPMSVFLVRSEATKEVDEQGIEKMEEALLAFRKDLENTYPDPNLDDCSDRDDCVQNIYAGQIGRLSENVFERHARVQTGFMKEPCNCIALIEPDLRKLEVLFSRQLDGSEGISLKYIIAIILLHEIGHHEKGFTVQPTGKWADTYTTLLTDMNAGKQEELRADIYAAVQLREACFSDNNHPSYDLSETCLYLTIHPLLYDMYTLFDKSQAGLCRRYLDPPGDHPNYYLRYMLMSVIMAEGLENVNLLDILTGYLETREIIKNKPWAKENEKCIDRISNK